MSQSGMSERRKFILSMARSIGLAGIGALVWSSVLEESAHASLLLRPPGALSEEEFLRTCIKCGLCVSACPYDTLMLAAPGDKKPMGTPFYNAREIPCYMCTDIPCVPVCPSGALDESSVSTDGVLDINIARMGVAVVDSYACIAFWGIQCDACYRACPLLDKAIFLEYEKNERTGKHAFLKPVVVPDVCTGCGMCEHACITEKASIIVLPREVAMGRAGDHYVKGWDKKDQERVKDAHGGTTKTELSKRSILDSLSDDSGLFE